MDYRTQTPPQRSFSMQTAPTSSGVVTFVFGLLFAGPTSVPLAAAVRTGQIGMGLFCSLFVVVGALLMAMSVRELRTRRRFVLTDDELVIEWVRGGKVSKHERIPRAELIDVAVNDAPSSGTPLYGLVLGTRNGEIDLSGSRISWGEAFFDDRCQQLAFFLEIPVRPR